MTQQGDNTTIARQVSIGWRPTHAFVVEIVSGPDAGLRVTIDGRHSGKVHVGQSQTCDLKLTDRAVSKRHLALDIHEEGLAVSDLSSTNGTRINGVRVASAILSGGETIAIGDSMLAVRATTADHVVEISDASRFGRMLGASLAMRRLFPLCDRLASSDVNVLIEGETGTGKEVLAEAIHEQGPRRDQPFVVFDCTTVAPTLMESALFGHERGAFTGATDQQIGVFEQAHRGTLLIDEIGDLDIALQPKLLRVIERGELKRIGGTKSIAVDVRVLAATRRNLENEVQKRRFRDDLFFRLAIARIELPPLRERKEDIALLAAAFFARLGGKGSVPFELVRKFEDHTWPGNIRELHNAVARYLAVGSDLPILQSPITKEADGVADEIAAILAEDLPYPHARDRVLAEFERRYVARVLDRHGGNVALAADASGIGRRYFQMIRARLNK
jgi:two-component system, NtrC family, response regulator HydG